MEGGPDVFICGECIELCQSIIDQEKARRNLSPRDPSSAVREQTMREKLDHLVSGQDEAKEALARVVARRSEGTRHVLLIGPSSCSMAFLGLALAHVLKVPFAAGDGRTLIEPHGGNPIPLLFKLLDAGGFDLEACQRGVICVNEWTSRTFGNRYWPFGKESKAVTCTDFDLMLDVCCSSAAARLPGLMMPQRTRANQPTVKLSWRSEFSRNGFNT